MKLEQFEVMNQSANGVQLKEHTEGFEIQNCHLRKKKQQASEQNNNNNNNFRVRRKATQYPHRRNSTKVREKIEGRGSDKIMGMWREKSTCIDQGGDRGGDRIVEREGT